MMWDTIPSLGHALMLINLVTASYALSLGLASATRRELLDAARRATYGAVALLGAGTLLLAYAFVAHDFRISYVARYSDRSMPLFYLLSSLWGGQDGSILWWMMLLGMYTAAVLRWMRGRYLQLQPYVIATLMSVLVFFSVITVFAANPFAENLTTTPADGQGLNPLLQTIYMAVHPPALYLGFVGCSIPFAFAVAALVTGKLDNKWILAIRKWMLFAWIFLTIGNGLGMLWAYVELGWGGYWGWDPVENASLLPWFTATAYVHSTMVQERRKTFRRWNIVLVFVTFFLTIFGTFLTRSGAISSVHAFSKSTMGDYFVWYMGALILGSIGLLVWRREMLTREYEITDPVSKEGALLGANVSLVGAMLFVGIATVFPMITEAINGETVSVGPDFYNHWMVPVGLLIVGLMGVAPLLGWGRTNRSDLHKSLSIPSVAAVVVTAIHLGFGSHRGLPAIIHLDALVSGAGGTGLKAILRVAPALTTFLLSFALAVIIQELIRTTRAKRKATGRGWLSSFWSLVSRSRRRYGGYLSHVGVILMFLGFLGQAWGVSGETSLKPGERYVLAGYTLRYVGPRQQQDTSKNMTFADLSVTDRWGDPRGTISPGKFLYRNHPEEPTSEIDVLHSLRDDLYVVLGSLDPSTGRANLQVHINPMVSWIWLGLLLLLAGAAFSLWPSKAGFRAAFEGARPTSSTPHARVPWFERLLRLPASFWGTVLVAITAIIAWFKTPAIALLFAGGLLILLGISWIWSSLQVLAGDRLPVRSTSLPVRSRAEHEEKAFLINALEDIEIDVSIGKMSQDAYNNLAKQVRERARRIVQVDEEPSAEDIERAQAAIDNYLKKNGLEPFPVQQAPMSAAPLPKSRPVCPSCGVSNEPDAKFCKSCGQQLDAQPEGEGA